MSHAPIAPSALALTVACPASVGLQASVVPLPPTTEEMEGTAAHFVAMHYAAGECWPVGTKFMSSDQQWEVTLDMVVGATMYARACGGPHTNLRLEDSVRISRVHPQHCWGTPDAWRFFPDAREATEPGTGFVGMPLAPFMAGHDRLIRIVDYKFGHRYVEVFENYQFLAYAYGVMERLGLSEQDQSLWLELIVVQPRCYHKDGPVRRWIVRACDVGAYLNVAASAAREALGEGSTLDRHGKPRAIINENCYDCKARHACKVQQYATGAVLEFTGKAELVEMPPDAMGRELALVDEAIAILEARRTGLAAQAEAMIRAGTAIAFYHLEAGESRLVYKEDADTDELIGMGDVFGVNVRKTLTKKDLVVTPKQAIDLGIDPEVMKSYAFRPRGALKLVRDNSQTVRKVFSK